jgi:AbrB family looped-hinge helix DNA binding protein
MNTQHYSATINEQGRVIIPAKLRQALHLEKGGAVIIYSDGDTLRIVPKLNLLRDAQALVKKHVPAKVDLVENLLLERRKEVATEKHKMGHQDD